MSAALLALAVPVAGAAEPRVLQRADGVPDTAEAAAQRPALMETVQAYLAKETAVVHIAHPGGAAGSAWAHKVQQWLVAFGVPSADIRVDPGVTEPGRLELRVANPGDGL